MTQRSDIADLVAFTATVNNPLLVLGALIKYGLAIRQIPTSVTSLFSITGNESDDQIVRVEILGKNFEPFFRNRKDSPHFEFDHENKKIYRKFRREVRVPEHAGWWMCQQVGNTSSTVRWDKSRHNLASTLEGSIMLFIDSLEKTEREGSENV